MKMIKINYSAVLSVVLSASLVLFTAVFCNELGTFTQTALNKVFGAGEKTVEYMNTPLEGGSGEKKNFAILGFGSGKKEEKRKDGNETDIPGDIKELMKKYEKLYDGYKKSGNIQEIQMGASSVSMKYGNVTLNNKTESHKADIKSELNKTPSFGKITKDEPYILIYHTHTTEGYEILDKGWYSNDYNSRTENVSKTVVRVGDEITEQLENAGYKVIHDKTVYDSTYNGAYSRSLVTVEKYLKQYPSIQVTIDVHRDAIHYDSGTKCKPTAVINGKKAAQIMIITGCEEGDITDFPDWQKNLTFAVALQNKVEEKYNGLMRPIFFCQRKYNMNVTPCSLLLEFGTDANTLDEAVYSGRLLGKSLASLLDDYCKKE